MAQTQTFRGVQTSIVKDGHITRFIYRGTTVVELDEDAMTVRLQSNGWRTTTTKLRFRQAATQHGLSFAVYQEAFAWYVTTNLGTFDYSDGMLIHLSTGLVETASGNDVLPLSNKPHLVNGCFID